MLLNAGRKCEFFPIEKCDFIETRGQVYAKPDRDRRFGFVHARLPSSFFT